MQHRDCQDWRDCSDWRGCCCTCVGPVTVITLRVGRTQPLCCSARAASRDSTCPAYQWDRQAWLNCWLCQRCKDCCVLKTEVGGWEGPQRGQASLPGFAAYRCCIGGAGDTAPAPCFNFDRNNHIWANWRVAEKGHIFR